MIKYFNTKTLQDEVLTISKFPAGELNLNIEDVALPQSIELIYESSDDLIALMLFCNAVKHANSVTKGNHFYISSLTIKYLPYGRQDRVCCANEPFGLEVICDVINSLGFSEVIVYDPHSEVQTKLLNNCVTIPQHVIWKNTIEELKFNSTHNIVLVSPDEGAHKKTALLAGVTSLPFIRMKKKRDPSNGKLSGFELIDNAVFPTNTHYIIVDDICDGGGTFIGQAGVLKDVLGSTKMSLMVTHGIFSKGTVGLKKVFDDIYTTDSLICKTPNPEVLIINTESTECEYLELFHRTRKLNSRTGIVDYFNCKEVI